jgi:D-alanine-D-alanine ligase-like ATP-grasp enzyme
MLGNRRAMKHVAILKADGRAGRAARLSSGRRAADPRERPLAHVGFDPASQAFEGTDAKNAEGGPHRFPWENLKPIIYHNVQDLTPEARRAPGRRESRRAGLHFSEATGDGGELVELKVKAEPGMTVLSLAPGRAARAGSSFHEPGAGMVEDASCGG